MFGAAPKLPPPQQRKHTKAKANYSCRNQRTSSGAWGLPAHRHTGGNGRDTVVVETTDDWWRTVPSTSHSDRFLAMCQCVGPQKQKTIIQTNVPHPRSRCGRGHLTLTRFDELNPTAPPLPAAGSSSLKEKKLQACPPPCRAQTRLDKFCGANLPDK